MQRSIFRTFFCQSLFSIAALCTPSHAQDLVADYCFLIVSKQTQMLPLPMWLDIVQALPVFSSAGETSLFQIKMAL